MSKKWDERKRDVDSKDSSNHKKKGSFGQKLEAAFNKLFGKESSHNSSKSHAEKEGTLYERKPSAVPSQTMKLDLKPSAMKDAKFDEREREYSEVKSLKPKTLSKKKTTPAQIHEGGLREERDIVIGFDLGTSCTKVILQDRQLKKCYAVPFQELGHEANKYLLPSKIFICKDGRLSLDVGDYEYKRIKINFIKNSEKEIYSDAVAKIQIKSSDLLVGYISLVLMEIRKWFFDTRENDYRHVKIDWQLNIGLPSRSYDDVELFNRTKIAGLAAWNISLLPPEEVTINNIQEALKRASTQVQENTCNRSNEEIHPDYVNAIPEIVAEVAGFARSPLREDGMYMMVDVGAMTLDVSSFIIHKDMDENDEDAYEMLTSSVENNGTYMLHNNRIEGINKYVEVKINSLRDKCDEMTPIPEPKDYVTVIFDNNLNVIKKSDYEFKEGCSLQVRQVIKETKICKNPNSDKWVKGLPLFICGGGSLVSLYQELPQNVTECLQQGVKFKGFEIKSLPKPKDLVDEGIPPNDYHRMAVSYGLSFSKIDLGKIRPEREIKDIDSGMKKLDLDSRYISKDLV